MSAKDSSVLDTDDVAVIDFLLMARDAGRLRVRVGSEVLAVKVTTDQIGAEGRTFLTRGKSQGVQE